MGQPDLERLAVDTIRFLAADAVQRANSGHPGLPMGAAAMAYALWTRHLKHAPTDPSWPDRDRFVLSAGHGSMLLYALLHLTGYDLSLDDLRAFRQWGSRTPGHPENHLTPGVEATTGPLGQGISNAVGLAIAEAHLAARFNRPGHDVVDHHTWVLASDGDLMEGVASEACSLAGHLGLGKLNVLYDQNHISLSGSTSLCFTEDVGARFAAYGWHVQHVDDGNDVSAVDAALSAARAVHDKPSIILVRTIIGFGAPHKQNTYEAHGSPLGPDELRAAKEALGWPTEPAFLIPAEVEAHFRTAVARGQTAERAWRERLAAYRAAHADLADELERRFRGDLPAGWDGDLPAFPADDKGLATRKASEQVMQRLAAALPEFVGGSADLNPSTYTWLKALGDFQPSDPRAGRRAGRDRRSLGSERPQPALRRARARDGIHRERSRAARRLHPVRLDVPRLLGLHASRRSGSPPSAGSGPSGSTRTTASASARTVRRINRSSTTPLCAPFRTCSSSAPATPTRPRWPGRSPIAPSHGPTVLALTRQNLPTLDRTRFASADGLRQGAYVLNPAVDRPDLLLLATGSELHLVVAAAALLDERGVRARIVSMPCWELFEEQPAAYRDAVLPPQTHGTRSPSRRACRSAGIAGSARVATS